MYAVVSTGGKQLKVEKGTVAVVEKLDASVGDSVTLDVLFVADEGSIIAGADAQAATVTAEIVEHFKGDKQIVFKFKKRKGYKVTKGHRQELTRVLITGIEAAGGKKKAEKAEAPKAEKAEKAPKAEKAAPAAEEATEKQCAAVKSNGERCTNKAKEGSEFCGVHAKKAEG